MLRVLVLFHLYYKDQLDYFLSKMENISGCIWNLLVTGPDLDSDTRNRILAFKNDATFLPTSNVGYDLWPFIAAVKSVDLDSYDVLIKLHTKSSTLTNRINGMCLKGFAWRDMLVDSLLSSRSVFSSVLESFSDPAVGLVCSRSLYKRVSDGLYEDLGPLEEELSRLGITTPDRHFCAGTMFAARTSPYKLLQTDLVHEEMFSPGASHSVGTTGHLYERIVCILVRDAGFRTETVSLNRLRDAFVLFHKGFSPLLSWLFALSRKGEEGHKYLTIFGIDIKIAD